VKLLNSYKYYAIYFLTIGLSSPVFSQDSPIRWGEIPKADLEMKYFPQDTNASALIICDFGESHYNNDLDIVFNRHLRIKIFTSKGYEWATHSTVLYTDDETERISKIEGVTYVLDDKGEIIQTPLSEKDIFEEDIDGKRTRYRFTLPGVKPGCIVEIRYSIKTKDVTLVRDWVFQHSEPVRWSEYQFRFPKCFSYTALHHGYEAYTIREINDFNYFFSGFAGSLFRDGSTPCTSMRWAVENIPALREEPYVTTIEDYIKKVEIQLSGYPNALGSPKNYLKDWGALIDKLLDAEWFSKRIDVTKKVKIQAEEITSSFSSPEEKMRAIYDWVKNSIVYSGSNRRYAEQEVNEIMNSKKGNNAESTFLLLSLLQSVGISGDPVILSTRENGKIQKTYPIESQFNYVLARVQLGSEKYYLDATDPLRPLELLPKKVLNTTGLVIKKDTIEWVTITSPKRNSVSSLALLSLNEDGSFTGTFEDSHRDYGSLIMRHDLMDKKEIDIAKEQFKTEQMGITIDSIQIEGKDSILLPLKLKAWISSPSYAQLNGDLIYINPHILYRDQNNPFKSERRDFPIDYAYEISQMTLTNITIPNCFEVKERLVDRKLVVGSNFVRYTREIQVDSNIIQVRSKFEVRKIELEPEYYARLREVYTQMVALQSEQFVLARKKPVIDSSKNVPSAKQIQKKGKK
jgi:hypothetical protein